MGLRDRRGFTLVELLIVIVIIALIAALLLPAILKALCSARQGTAEHLVDQLSQAAKAYELDYALYPPGKGDGSKELAFYLQQKGPKKNAYFEFTLDMLSNGHVINPVHADGEAPVNIMYYRKNQQSSGQPGGGGGGGGGGGAGGQPPVYMQSSFQLWCAGCNYSSSVQTTLWSVNNWE